MTENKMIGAFKSLATKETWANGQKEFHIAKKPNKNGVHGHYVVVRLNGITTCIYKSKALQNANPSLQPTEFGDNPVWQREEGGKQWTTLGTKQRELTPDTCPEW